LIINEKVHITNVCQQGISHQRIFNKVSTIFSIIMKHFTKIIIVLAMLVCIATKSNGQPYPIPAKSATIGYLTFFGPPGLPGAGTYGSIEKYEAVDTVINNITYQHWNSHFTRYKDNRMWLLDPQKSTPDSLVERVYYDFNLAENDSFLIFDEHYAVVTNVTVYNTPNGQQRKRIRLFIEEMPGGARMDWIEGIGDVNNGILYENQLGLSDVGSFIVCFTDSSGLAFKKQGFDFPCDSLDSYVNLYETSAKTENILSVDIWPNPFQNAFSIKVPNPDKLNSVSLFNTSGILLLRSQNTLIDTQELAPGIYFVRIDYDSEYYFRKMLKN
jgi:hypothetical protein